MNKQGKKQAAKKEAAKSSPIDLFRSIVSEGSGRPEIWQSVLNDEQWREIARWSGLPSEARTQVAQYIIIYREEKRDQASTLTLAKTRELMQKLAEELEGIAYRIETVLDNATAAWALRNHNDKIFRFQADMIGFAKLLRKVSGEFGRDRPGPKNWPLQRLVIKLADLLERYNPGLKLSLSGNVHGPDRKWNAVEFISQTAMIADPALKKQTVRNVIRVVVGSRKKDRKR